ncbi:MAG TPA: hypothetical protein VFX30_11605 [bacterium]|nr:hypothetical protein [bacterium]
MSLWLNTALILTEPTVQTALSAAIGRVSQALTAPTDSFLASGAALSLPALGRSAVALFRGLTGRVLTPEERVFAALGTSGVPTAAQVDGVMNAFGFVHKRRGTYYSPLLDCYLYRKYDHITSDPQTARSLLAKARELTAARVFYPGTRWGLFQDELGNYQLMGATRALVGYYDPKDTPEDLPGLTERLTDLLGRVKKSDRTYLNAAEARHASNWGWSRELSRWFPIDVEVFSFPIPEGKEARTPPPQTTVRDA